MAKKTLYYLAHPYGGNDENIDKARNIHKQLKRHIFSPVEYYPYLKDIYSENQIMNYCLDMLSRCDILYVAPGWENSEGCKKEIEFARENNIPIRYLKELVAGFYLVKYDEPY